MINRQALNPSFGTDAMDSLFLLLLLLLSLFSSCVWRKMEY
jgi:hypothetical protein